MVKKEIASISFALSCIVLLVVFFQFPSLNLDVYGDDYALVKSYTSQELIKPFYTNLANINPAMTPVYRPLAFLKLHAAHKICGFDPYNLHMMIILLQVLQTAIVFLFFRMLIQNNSIALAGALLFPLNPNNWWHFTCSGEMPEIAGMIPFLLSLITLLMYIRSPRGAMMFLHCFFAAWAYMTKEVYAPLFFLSILTIYFYKRHQYKQYIPIVGWHMVIFIIYLSARTLIIRGFGGQGTSPDNYSGIGVYLLNYMNFLSKISLFNNYINSGSWYFLLYLTIVCIFLIALKNVLAFYRVVNRKLVFVILASYLALLFWLPLNPDKLRALPQLKLRGGSYEGFWFVCLVGLYLIIMLVWTNRKAVQNSSKGSFLPGTFKAVPEDKLERQLYLSQRETLMKFFSYSCWFLLISGLPMFFFPEGRIMYVTAIGMGGVFASSFFVVLSMTRKNSYKVVYHLNGKKLLRYGLCIIFIVFVLKNGGIYEDKYTGSDSIYHEYNILKVDITTYVQWYPYFKEYDMTEQGAHLFYKLVSRGLVDRESGKLIMNKVNNLYAPIEETMRGHCIKESEMADFLPTDKRIYPFIN